MFEEISKEHNTRVNSEYIQRIQQRTVAVIVMFLSAPASVLRACKTSFIYIS